MDTSDPFTMSVTDADPQGNNNIGDTNTGNNIESSVTVGVIEPDTEQQQPKPTLSVPNYRQEFNNLFYSTVPLDKTPLEILKVNAYSGALSNSPLRGLAWRIFLGCLDTNNIDNWETIIKNQRQMYKKLLDDYYVDPRSPKNKEVVFDPLSCDETSPWNKFFKNQEVQKTISLDIERTYQDFDYFQKQTTKDMMLRILFIYSRMNGEISYRQGMHELLAPMLYLIQHEVEKYVKIDNEYSMVDIIYDKNYIEHDTFTIFISLMKITSNWFGLTSSPGTSSPNTSSNNLFQSKPSLIPFEKPEQKEEPMINEAVTKCKNINKLLKQKDIELYSHLESLEIEPQIYLLRWIRLLFGREFHLEDVLNMWDSLFAYGENLILIDYVSISMMIYIRDQILGRDNSSVLKRLFKYPPVEDIHLLIQQAFKIKDNPGPALNLVNYNQSSHHYNHSNNHNQNNHHHNPTPIHSNHNNSILSSSPTNSTFTPFGSSNLIDPLGSTATTSNITFTTQNTTSTSTTTTTSTTSSRSITVDNSRKVDYRKSMSHIQSSSTFSSDLSSRVINFPTYQPPPQQQQSTISNSQQQQPPHKSSNDLFSKEAESLTGIFSSSVNLSTARNNYGNFNSRQATLPPKQSYVTKKPTANSLHPEVRKLRNLQKYFGNTLNTVVPVLQQGFVDNNSLTNHDALVLAVAQIKQIKDMLLGELPLPEAIPEYELDLDSDSESNSFDPLGASK